MYRVRRLNVSRLNFLVHQRELTNSFKSENSYCEIFQQRRTFSFETTVQNLVQTQTGIFKALSESTPVEYTQKLLLTVHDTTGLPWWATIISTTIMLRGCITFPLAVYQHYILAKLENLKLEMPAIVEEIKREVAIAIKLYKWDEKRARTTFNRAARKQWKELIIRDNCHPFKASLLILVQIPMWLSLSISLRNLVYMLPNRDIDAYITFTELTLGGFSFIPNLTEVDASLILPVALGIINLAIIELQMLSRINEPTKFQRYITNFFRVFSVAMVPISATVPSCLALYWTTSSAIGLFQNVLLMSPKVKRTFGIPITEKELAKPYSHALDKFKTKVNSISLVSKTKK